MKTFSARSLVRSRGLVLAGGMVSVAVLLSILIRIFPLQFMDASDRFKLWRAGIESVESPAGDHGVEWRSPECRHIDETSGAAPARCTCVVFVHGMGDSVLTWRKILTHREWLKSSPGRLRLIAWDLPGHGRTAEPPHDPNGDLQLRAQAMAQRLLGASQMRGCGPDSIWVGNSLGGWVASWAALKRPDQMRSLILLAPAGVKEQRLGSVGSSVLAEPTVESIRTFRQQAYAKPQADYPDWVWRAAVERVRKSPVSRVRGAQQSEDDLDGPIQHLSVPTRALWGKGDRILPLDKSSAFRAIPSASLVKWQEVEDCGHLPQKECPSVVTDAIVEALKSVPSP